MNKLWLKHQQTASRTVTDQQNYPNTADGYASDQWNPYNQTCKGSGGVGVVNYVTSDHKIFIFISIYCCIGLCSEGKCFTSPPWARTPGVALWLVRFKQRCINRSRFCDMVRNCFAMLCTIKFFNVPSPDKYHFSLGSLIFNSNTVEYMTDRQIINKSWIECDLPYIFYGWSNSNRNKNRGLAKFSVFQTHKHDKRYNMSLKNSLSKSSKRLNPIWLAKTYEV